MSASQIEPFDLVEPTRELLLEMLQTMLQRIRTAFAMIVAMEPLDATRQMVWQLVGCDSKACAWSARIIEFRK